jgi:hypothetical protein
MKTTRFLSLVILTVLAPGAGAQDMPKAMKKIFSDRPFAHYQWLNYPVDNYGIATAYKGTKDRLEVVHSFAPRSAVSE